MEQAAVFAAPAVFVLLWSSGFIGAKFGLAYAELHQVERAWPLLRAAAKSRPRDPDLYTRIATILEADGRTAQAIDMYRQSLELNPDQYTAVVRLAKLLAGKGSNSEASALERRAKILLPRGSAR